MHEKNENMRQLCREIFGTDNKDDLIEIAKKAEKYDLLVGKKKKSNTRNAGRKSKFSEEDVDLMIEMYHQDKNVQRIAGYFHTSRQTIYKYLQPERRFELDPFITMRMNYMLDQKICTIIDVDFRHEQIYITNKTNNLLHRAFGVIEEPSWDDFQRFLEERCFPRTRAELKLVLREVGVSSYDPMQIVEKTQGRMAEDHQWLDIIYKENIKGGETVD